MKTSSQEAEWARTLRRAVDSRPDQPTEGPPLIAGPSSRTRVREGHRARWLVNGDDAHAAIVLAIEQAMQTVRLESYIVRVGSGTTRIFDALRHARRRGVDVRLLVDAFGCESLPLALLESLRASGVLVRVFNPLKALRLSFRNHRKLLVCDDRVAIIGGRNIGPEYEGDGIERGWYDLSLELNGPIAASLACSFDRMFELAPFTKAAVHAFRSERLRSGSPAGAVELLTSGPGCRRGELRRVLHKDLRGAQEVTVMAGYFLPSSRVRRELAGCIRRGGRVDLLLAGRTDVPLAKRASEHLYGRLLKRGVRIYEYQPQVLHAKLLVLDDVVYLGSCNLDRRSLHINYEFLVRLEWPELADDARELFREAIKNSIRIDTAQWQRSFSLWRALHARVAYWLLARLDPLVASRKLKFLG